MLDLYWSELHRQTNRNWNFYLLIHFLCGLRCSRRGNAFTCKSSLMVRALLFARWLPLHKIHLTLSDRIILGQSAIKLFSYHLAHYVTFSMIVTWTMAISRFFLSASKVIFYDEWLNIYEHFYCLDKVFNIGHWKRTC